MSNLSPQLEQALSQAKQKGLISHTKAQGVGFTSHSQPNEPNEPINQTLSGIITTLIITLFIIIFIAIAIYLFN